MSGSLVVIDEKNCLGCGYCAVFCPQGCFDMKEGKLTPEGYLLPAFMEKGECKACGICAVMCPAFAIEVYRVKPGKSVKGKKES